MKKRGLSTVLATAIIVSLTVVGTVILWSAIKPSIDDVEDKLDTGQLNAILDILKVDIIDGLVAKVIVKNRGTGSVSSVKIVISDEDSSKSYNVAGLGEFETKTFDVPLEIVKPVSVEAYPSIKTSSGKVIAGGVRGEAREKDISYSSDSLIGYWDMETLTDDGKLKDLSGKGSDGIIYGGPTQGVPSRASALGKAFEFDGTDDYVDMGNPPVLNQNFGKISLSFWVYPIAATDVDAGLVGKGTTIYGTTYHIGNPPAIYGYIRGGGDAVFLGAPVSLWYHVVLTFDKDVVSDPMNKIFKKSLYINGDFAGGVNVPQDPTGTGGTFLVGKRVGAGSFPDVLFNGKIDEVRVYDKALTEEEVNALYQQGQ